MGRVTLIGGPSDGQEVEGPTRAAVLDIEGSRYVLRRTNGRHRDVAWVGIFLPLYAGILKARSGRRPRLGTGA
jgi:hypothetical protein